MFLFMTAKTRAYSFCQRICCHSLQTDKYFLQTNAEVTLQTSVKLRRWATLLSYLLAKLLWKWTGYRASSVLWWDSRRWYLNLTKRRVGMNFIKHASKFGTMSTATPSCLINGCVARPTTRKLITLCIITLPSLISLFCFFYRCRCFSFTITEVLGWYGFYCYPRGELQSAGEVLYVLNSCT